MNIFDGRLCSYDFPEGSRMTGRRDQDTMFAWWRLIPQRMIPHSTGVFWRVRYLSVFRSFVLVGVFIPFCLSPMRLLVWVDMGRGGKGWKAEQNLNHVWQGYLEIWT